MPVKGKNRSKELRGGADEFLTVPMREGGSPVWAFVAPVPYGIGMANLGVHEVFYMLRSMGVGAERVFSMPPPHRSLEGNRRLSDFPIITASVAYEPDAVTFLQMLATEGIPLAQGERAVQQGPLVGIGGALCSINPLIFAAIADFVVLGDGEPLLPFLVDTVRQFPGSENRGALLECLAGHPAFYVPPVHGVSLSADVPLRRKRSVSTEIDVALGHSLWIAEKAAFGSSLLMELQRGCVRHCPYCTIPGAFGPVRRRSVEDVKRRLEEIAAFGAPFSQVGLVTPEAGDYPELPELLAFLEEKRWGVSFASLRLDSLTSMTVKALTRSGRFSLTLAPEAGNATLRRKCGKPFDNDTILEKIAMARAEGVRRVKLYFMIGLPGESDEDVVSIADLARRVREQTGVDVSLSVGAFVPKPRSFWEGHSFVGAAEAKRRFRLLGSELRGRDRCEYRHASAQEAHVENALSWVDGEGSRILATAISAGEPVSNELLDRVTRFSAVAKPLVFVQD